MPDTQIKIICCDVDGTLVCDDKTISEDNKYWIKKAVDQKKIKFVIVSGRMLSGIRNFYKELQISGPVVGYNGCALYDENDNLIIDHRVPSELSQLVINKASEYGVNVIFFDDQDWYMESNTGFVHDVKKPFYGKECKVADLKELSKQKVPNKLILMDEEHSKVEALTEDLKKMGLEKKLYFYKTKDFLELMDINYTKGTSIDDLSRWYGVEKSQIMAIGDDFNDCEMIENAGLGVAVSNAVDKLKAVANVVLPVDNMHSAVAYAIQKYIFEE